MPNKSITIKNNEKIKYFLMLTLIYILGHFALLIVTGRWWDDWFFYNTPETGIELFYNWLGRPTGIWITKFVKLMPESGYRIITFLMYYFNMLFLYQILKNSFELSNSASFCLSAIYCTIPTNADRIMACVFPYTIGLFFFMLAACCISYFLFRSKLNIPKRLLCLALFFASFILNSNLCFYALIILLILKKEKSIKKLIRYWDFILLPFVFYIGKSVLFPVSGGYYNYNEVSLKTLAYAAFNSVIAALHMMQSLAANYVSIGGKWILLVAMIVIIVFIIVNIRTFRKREDSVESLPEILDDKKSTIESLLIILAGLVALYFALFIYVNVRLTTYITTTGFGSRDAMLVGLGAALILYGGISIFIKPRYIPYIACAISLCGCIYFNINYLSYQEDYYRQLGFRYQLSLNQEIDDAEVILYLNNDDTIINVQSIYQLNGNAQETYGKQDKLIIGGINSTNLLRDDYKVNREMFVETGIYHMSDYDVDHQRIDLILQYSLNMTLKDTIKLKIYEIFNKTKFEETLENATQMSIYWDGSDEYNNILKQIGYTNVE